MVYYSQPMVVMISERNNYLWIIFNDDSTSSEMSISRALYTIGLLASMAIFIVTKFLLLKWTLTPRSIIQNPHNTLFFLDEMEKLLITPICTSIVIYDMLNNTKSSLTENPPNCGFRMLFMFMPTMTFFGGFGTALLRLLAVRCTQIVQRWGEFKVMGVVLLIWKLIMATTITLMILNTNVKYKDRCFNEKESEINFNPGPALYTAIIIEFGIYASICQFVYKSDMSVRQCISTESFNKRKQKNAFNFFGHWLYFMIELLTIIFGTLIFRHTKIPPRIWMLGTTTLLAISSLLLSKPMKIKWENMLMTDQPVKTSGTQKAFKSNSEPLRQSTIGTAPPSNQFNRNISPPRRTI